MIAAMMMTAVITAACAHIGAIGMAAQLLEGVRGTPGPAEGTVEIVARVEEVDPARQLVVVETETGMRGAVVYDGATRAFDVERREIRVGAVRPGRWARLRLHEAAQGYHLEELSLLREDVEEGDAPLEEAADTIAPQAEAQDTVPVMQEAEEEEAEAAEEVARVTLAGEVVSVDRDAGRFDLVDDEGARLRVSLRSDPAAEVRARFDRLRTGDRVRIEGEHAGPGRLELHGFLADEP